MLRSKSQTCFEIGHPCPPQSPRVQGNPGLAHASRLRFHASDCHFLTLKHICTTSPLRTLLPLFWLLLFAGCSAGYVQNLYFKNLSAPFASIYLEDMRGYPYLVTGNRAGTISIYDIKRGRFIDAVKKLGEAQPFFVGAPLDDLVLTKKAASTAQFLYLTRHDGISYLGGFTLTFESRSDVRISFSALGDKPIILHDQPRFADTGKPSNPSVNTLAFSDKRPITALWKLRYTEKSNVYNVYLYDNNGMRELNHALPDRTYTCANASCSFTVYKGKFSPNSFDFFYFNTLKAQPFALPGTAERIHLLDGTPVLAISDASGDTQLASFDMKEQELHSIVDVSTGQSFSIPFVPSAQELIFHDDTPVAFLTSPKDKHLLGYALEKQDGEIFRARLQHDIQLQEAITGISYDAANKRIYCMGLTPEANQIVDMSDDVVLLMSDYVDNAAALERFAFTPKLTPEEDDPLYERSSKARSILLSITHLGTLQAVDLAPRLEDLVKIDIYPSASDGSSFVYPGPHFRDMRTDDEAASKPRMEFLQTIDGKAKSEEWVLTYEGVIPSISGTGHFDDELRFVSDDLAAERDHIFTETVQDLTADTSSDANEGPLHNDSPLNPYPVVPNPYARASTPEALSSKLRSHGDALVMRIGGTTYEFPIEKLSDDGTAVCELSVGQRAVITKVRGQSLSFTLRAHLAYTVYGGSSGLQRKRLIEDSAYTTDNGALSFVVRSALLNPTSRGDAFVFSTFDGINYLNVGVSPGRVTFGTLSDVPVAFIPSAGDDTIALINLRNFRRETVISD